VTKPSITIYTFGKKWLTQPAPRYEFDLSNLRDPIGNLALKKECLDGRDPMVQRWIQEDKRVEMIKKECITLAKLHIVKNQESWLSIGFTDTHGIWISPAVGLIVAKALEEQKLPASLIHYGIGPGTARI